MGVRMNEIERVKEKALLTDEEILSVSSVSVDGCQSFKEAALRMYHAVCQAQLSKVLATEGVLVKSDDQSLPIPTFLEVSKTAASVDSETWAKMVAILDVITTRSRKAGFVRVVKEERKE